MSVRIDDPDTSRPTRGGGARSALLVVAGLVVVGLLVWSFVHAGGGGGDRDLAEAGRFLPPAAHDVVVRDHEVALCALHGAGWPAFRLRHRGLGGQQAVQAHIEVGDPAAGVPVLGREHGGERRQLGAPVQAPFDVGPPEIA